MLRWLSPRPKTGPARTTLRLTALEAREVPAAFQFNQARFGSYSYSTGIDVSPTNPDAKLLRTDYGGAYRWVPAAAPGGDQWQPVTDSLMAAESGRLFDADNPGLTVNGTTAARFDPSDATGNTLWLGTVSGVFKTTNFVSGSPVTWQKTPLPVADGVPQPGGGRAEPYRMDRTNRLLVDPNNSQVVYYGTVGYGLWRTTDSGASWQQVPAAQVPFFNYAVTDGDDRTQTRATAVSFVSADPTRGTVPLNGVAVSRRLYVGVRGAGVFQSDDGGQTFAKISGGAGQPPLTEIAPGSTLPKTWDRTTVGTAASAVDADGYLYVTVLHQKNDDGSVGLQQDGLYGGGVWRYRDGVWADITPNPALSYTPVDVWRNPATGKVRLYVTSGGFANDASIYFTEDAQAAAPAWTDITPTDARTVNTLPGEIGRAGGGAASITVDPQDPTGETVWLSGGWTNYRTTTATDLNGVWTEVANGHEELFGFDVEVGASGKLHFLFDDRAGLVADTADLDGRRQQMWSWSKAAGGLPAGTYSPGNNYNFQSGTGVATTRGNPDYVARIGDAWAGSVFNAFSVDGGETWVPMEGLPPSRYYSFGGQLRASATVRDDTFTYADPVTGEPRTVTAKVPTTLLWNTSLSNEFFVSHDNGRTWREVSNLIDSTPFWLPNNIWGRVTEADGADGNVFYAVNSWTGSGLDIATRTFDANGNMTGVTTQDRGNLYVSVDGGFTWRVGQVKDEAGNRILNDALDQASPIAVPGQAGGLFISSGKQGLFFSSNASTTTAVWAKVPQVQRAISFDLGKSAPGRSKPAAYVMGFVDNGSGAEFGLWRSDDLLNADGSLNANASWVKMAGLDTPMTNTGQPIPFSTATQGQSLAADPSVYGRVYLSLNGRGLMYGGIAGAAPTLGTPTATVDPSGLTARLAVTGADDGGEDNLQYFWRVTGKPAGAKDPQLGGVNGLNGAKSLTAAFFAAGTYTFEVKVTDSGGQTATKAVTLTVSPSIDRVGPAAGGSTTLAPGTARQLVAFDQFGRPLTAGVSWQVRGGGAGGTVSAQGVYTAPAVAGTDVVSATAAGRVASALVDVQSPVIDYANGFVASPNLSTQIPPALNGWGRVSIDGGALTLTDRRWSSGSAFDRRPVDARSFVAEFRVTFGSTGVFGDGLAFVISGNGYDRVGLRREVSSLGYSGDSQANVFDRSVAVTLAPYKAGWPTNPRQSGAGLYTRGETVGTRDRDLSVDGIDFHTGRPFDVRVSYDGSVLTLAVTDPQTGATSVQRFTVNLTDVLGGNSAFLGFTSSSGGAEVYSPMKVERFAVFADTPPAAPTGLTATTSGTSVTIRWTDSATNETGYIVERSTAADFSTGVARDMVSVNGTSLTVTGLAANTRYYFRVRAVNPVAESAFAAADALTGAATSLGVFTAATDIGAPRRAGRTTFNATTGTYTVRGGGADIWGTSDQFHFASKAIATDAEIVARVTGMTNGAWGEKAGVMIRQSTAANSPYVLVNYGAGIGVEMTWRETVGGGADVVPGRYIPLPTPAAPVWVRLVRRGNDYSGYFATTPGTPTDRDWVLVGTRTVGMPPAVRIGLAVTAHDNSKLATGTFTDVSVSETPVPRPWSTADLGNPAAAGSASFGANRWTVSGGGTGLGAASDQVRVVLRDTRETASVGGRLPVATTGEAGYLFRASAAADAPVVAVSVLAGRRIRVSWRDAGTNGLQTFDAPAGVNASARWLRVLKSGNTFTIQYAMTSGKPAAADWVTLRTVSLTTGGAQWRAGLFVAARAAGGRTTASFLEVDVTGGSFD